jgi:hypothetical protein
MKREKGTVKQVSEAELKKALADERRDMPRLSARLEVDVPLASWDEVRTVYTTNISKGGLLFSLAAPASIPASVELNLTLPDGAALTVPCQVRHVARRDDDDGFDVGVQFQPLDPSVRRVFEQAIERLGRG